MSVNEKMTAIADAIRAKTGGTESLTLDAMATEIPKIYEEGKKAEYDAFWDYYQSTTQYLYAFSYKWNDDIYKPQKDIVIGGSNACNGMFYYSKVTDTKVKITFVSSNNASSAVGFMNKASYMKTIREVVFNKYTEFNNTSFQDCKNLETMNVGGTIGQNGLNLQWSTKLNKTSIESVINALSDETDGLTVTLSKEAVNNAFGIDIDDESTYTEEWNTLRNSKSNWTFAYN